MSADYNETRKYIVMVSDNYHFMDDDYSSKYGVYDNKDEAINTCKRIVEGSIELKDGKTADLLCKDYCMSGEDAYIIGDASFSSRAYAKEYCIKNGVGDIRKASDKQFIYQDYMRKKVRHKEIIRKSEENTHCIRHTESKEKDECNITFSSKYIYNIDYCVGTDGSLMIINNLINIKI